MLPEPTEDVGKANPENSKVWGVANETILKSELNSFAFPVSLIDMLAAVLELTVLNLDKLVSDVREVLSVLNSLVNFPIAEISRFFCSILSLIKSFFGCVSASTRLSTIWVIFSPEPFVFNALI